MNNLRLTAAGIAASYIGVAWRRSQDGSGHWAGTTIVKMAIKDFSFEDSVHGVSNVQQKCTRFLPENSVVKIYTVEILKYNITTLTLLKK